MQYAKCRLFYSIGPTLLKKILQRFFFLTGAKHQRTNNQKVRGA